MKHALLFCAALTALGACRGGGGDVQPTGIQFNHDQLIASLNGNYLWDCTVTNDAGTAQTRFVLEQPLASNPAKALLVVAGRDHAEDVIVRKKGAASLFMLKDSSEILVASDGEVVGSGSNTSIGDTYPKGRCKPGNQYRPS